MNKLQLFEQYHMTTSSAEFLAGVYGHGAGIGEFSDSLPDGAHVIDVGAGLSDFGAAVATRRPDIRWTNFDLNYRREHVSAHLLPPLMEDAPDNVRYVTGDVLAPPADLLGSFDRAFSYNLVTHLLRADRDVGRTAVCNMAGLLKPGGLLQVGPMRGHATNPDRNNICELDSVVSDYEVDSVVDAITTSKIANIYHNAVWASGVAVYSARRFRTEPTGRYVISDDGGQTRHRLMSRGGLRLAGKLAAGAVTAYQA